MKRASLFLVSLFLVAPLALRGEGLPVRLVHVSSPFFFEDVDRYEEEGGQTAQEIREHQEGLNRTTFRRLLAHLRSNEGRAADGLVLSGDLGVDPCWISDDCDVAPEAPERREQVLTLVELLAESPVRKVYMVPGHADIPAGRADDAALRSFIDLIAEVERGLVAAGSATEIHNLVSCYLSTASSTSGCVADVGDSFRLIGFPSYSFSNASDPAVYESNREAQERQVATFVDLVSRARADGRRGLVLVDIAEIDDFALIARERYRGVPPDTSQGNVDRPRFSSWNISPETHAAWRGAVDSDAVAAILAGHVTDSHRSLYERPSSWIESAGGGATKVRLAPPLGVRDQDRSPIQARGFTLIELSGTTVGTTLFWYEPERGIFSAGDATEEAVEKDERGRTWLGILMAWPLHVFLEALRPLLQLAEAPKAIDTWAILVIALIAAFLTVVQVWQIPPAKSPGGAEQGPAPPEDDAATEAAFQSPFTSKFGKTVVTGLGGLAATTIVEQLETAPTDDLKLLYIVSFGAFFFIILFVGASFRGVIEAFRHRLTAAYSYPHFEPDDGGFLRNSWNRIKHHSVRTVRWVLSLGRPLFVAIDTFFNSIQGKNQSRTFLLQLETIRTQEGLQQTAEAVRAQLEKQLRDAPCSGEVRVNLSVLSATDSEVLYIARSPGSSTRRFKARSIASLSIRTGFIRWYLQSEMQEDADKLVLLTNEVPESGARGTGKRALPGEPQPVHLARYYQSRPGERYEAFIMFPVPWPRRAFDEGMLRQKGGIHISFAKEVDFRKIWSVPLPAKDNWADYFRKDKRDFKMSEVIEKKGSFGIKEKYSHIASALKIAISSYGMLIQDFREDVFVYHIEPRLPKA